MKEHKMSNQLGQALKLIRQNYKLIKTKNIIISDDTFNKLYTIIEKFLIFFKNLT